MAVLILALRLPLQQQRSARKIWTNHETQIEEPMFSCYQVSNETWNCAQDVDLNRDVDRDDSY